MRARHGILLAALCVTHAAAQTPLQDGYARERGSRAERDETIWALERAAVEHEGWFVRLWDAIRHSSDRFEPLGQAAFETLVLPATNVFTLGPDGSVQGPVAGKTPGTLDPDGWRALLAGLAAEGHRLEQCEFHHDDFRLDEQGVATSTVTAVGHVVRDGGDRVEIRATLSVAWTGGSDDTSPAPTRIEVTQLDMTRRAGGPVFRQAFEQVLPHASPMDDVLVHDFNGDGRSDFAYPSTNKLYLNEGDFTFRAERLLAEAPNIIFESVVADFTGDGRPDFLCAGASPRQYTLQTMMRLFLYEADEAGAFTGAPRRLGPPEMQFNLPDCFAVGDVDGDGDLDAYVTQYLAPYLNGQFPDPYYDANDGRPASLLINDGTGDFTDGTEAAGLAPKRYRRTFRSSLADLDADGDLDLVVVSDFAGVDLYLNDGAGRFTDVTESALDDASSFGMSHTFADFNTDGLVDLYVTGMGSTTSRRLQRMGLGRSDLPEFDRMRPRIGYGNRMYLADGQGRWLQPSYRDTVARSGWTWGAATLDYDLDGDPDLYVANGNQSGKSVQDYCTTFWCHDVYTRSSEEDQALSVVFAEELLDVQVGRASWNGYEHNHLFANLGDAGFHNVAHLAGLAIEQDCRAIVADDFDLDGRPDLLVVALDRRGRFPRRMVKLFRNEWVTDSSWIGVRLRGAPGVSPIGARIVVTSPAGRQADVVVTGDSAKSQHATLKHFGLGKGGRVDLLEVHWPNGAVSRLESPAIDRYHVVTP